MRNTYVWLATGLSLVAMGAARAEQGATGATADSDTLEEITITAERRTENLMTVPIAATALTADQLDDKAVTRLSDLQYAAPSLTISDAGLTQSVNIRGVGLASGSPAVANGVATYVDGLFQPPIVSTNQFYDIASVEVLRGPQGTLVGSNSTGGAIFINSQSPRLGETGGFAELGVGNYGASTLKGALNLPAGDTFALRTAGSFTGHDSFYDSAGPAHTEASKLDEKSGRLGLLWKPGAFQALAKVEATDRQTGGYAYAPIPGTLYAAFRPSDPFTLRYDSPTENHERALLSELELRYELPDGITLRSLSGYQDKNIHNRYDSDGTSAETAANPQQTSDQYVREREWTQEVNVISPTGQRSNWIVGGYLQHNLIDVNLHNTSAGFPTDIINPQDKITTGWFAQLNVNLTDQLELQIGARYSTFQVDGVGSVKIGAGIPGFPPAGVQVANLTGSEHDKKPSGKIDLNYKLDDNNLFYVFAARGYKPGGFNSATSTFLPEGVWDYEAGWKVTALDGHLRTQLGAFYYNYDNFQFGVLDLTSGRAGVKNLPSATIKGVEGQLQLQLGGWGADAGFAYVDSNLGGTGSFVNTLLLPPGTLGPQCAAGVPSNPPTCFDYGPYEQTASSGPNLYSPKWTWNAGLEYKFNLPGSGATLTPRLNYAYLGSQFTSLSYSPLTDYLPSRGLLSALVTAHWANQWTAELYGTNLTDKTYVTGQSASNEFYGPPRQFGARVSFTF